MLQKAWIGVVVLSVAAGCAHRAIEGPHTIEDQAPIREDVATEQFEDALDRLVRHDLAGDWSLESCQSVAKSFARLGQLGPKEHRAESFYNAGLAYQRCQQHEPAQKMFHAALDAAPQGTQHRAEAQLALYEYESSGDRDTAIRRLNEIIEAAKYQNVEALVSVAALQIERGVARNSTEDIEAARKNLQRALAIDDSFMPALNQLALLQLTRARMSAGVSTQRRGLVLAGARHHSLSQQQLDMAALITSQGLHKNPHYAPLHNTAGLVQVELRNYNAAIRSFKRARELDPKFFEAHMNYGAVNLGIRGFAEAEKAYRAALKLDDESYEAHLGLALALRGQIGPSSDGKFVAQAERHLKRAQRLAPERPEAYYNAAILAQEFRAKTSSVEASLKELEAAYCLYGDFVRRAMEGQSEAKERANDRRQDIVETLRFMTNDSGHEVSCGG